MSLLPLEELTASHRLLWRTSKLPIDIAMLCHRGQSRLDWIQCIDELMASLIATVKECILALVQGFSIDSSLLSVQLEYASEWLPMIAQLGIESNGFPCSLLHDMVHHILLGTLYMNWLRRDLLYFFLDLNLLCLNAPFRLLLWLRIDFIICDFLSLNRCLVIKLYLELALIVFMYPVSNDLTNNFMLLMWQFNSDLA